MTTYYAKAEEVLNKAVYDVNPAAYGGIWPKLGKLGKLDIKDPWGVETIHANALKKALASHYGLEPEYADAEILPEPFMTRPIWVNWSYSLTDKQMRSINADPTSILAQMTQKGLIAQQNYMRHSADIIIANFLATSNPTTSKTYVADWVGCFTEQAATGTALKPQSCSAAPGTTTDLGTVNLTGAAMSVDALRKGFDIIKKTFATFVDSTTFERLGHITQGNTYTLFANPEVIETIEDGNLSNASGEVEYSQNIGEIMNKKYDVVKTYAFDAAYNGAADTVAEYGMALNVTENFVAQEIVPYTVSPWEEFKDPKAPLAKTWRKWGGMRIVAFPVPRYVNSTWIKAFQSFKNTPYAET